MLKPETVVALNNGTAFLKTGSFCDFLFCPDIVPNNHKTGDRIPFRCQPVYLQKEHSKNVWAELQPAILLIFVGHFTNFTLFPWILATLFQLSHHGLAIGKVSNAWGQLPTSGTDAAMTAAIGAAGAAGAIGGSRDSTASRSRRCWSRIRTGSRWRRCCSWTRWSHGSLVFWKSKIPGLLWKKIVQASPTSGIMGTQMHKRYCSLLTQTNC